MPGWHERTRELQEAGRLRLVGIVEEQHAARCRLFMQWQGMRWPILVDSLNLTGAKVIPLAWLVDEHGVIRAARVRDPDALDAFLAADYPPPAGPAPAPPSWRAPLAELRRGDDPRSLGDALFLRGDGADDLDAAVAAYRRAVERDPGDERAWFRLGVALRRRFEGGGRRAGDFQAAVEAWSRALELDPDQYIWRRRLQQYGPLPDKPYPFYDWVRTAREELRVRGEEPAPLPVEPRGSELAGRAPGGEAGPGEPPPHPDPEGRVTADPGRLVQLEAVIVPGRGTRPARGGRSLRLHLLLRPNPGAHWNNEAQPTRVWLDLPPGWSAEPAVGEAPLPRPAVATSDEERVVEFDLYGPADGDPPEIEVAAFYAACRDDGACLYRRQDLRLEAP